MAIYCRSLFSPPFFPLLRPSFSPFGLREMKPYRVPVSASAKISAPISLSFLPRPPLHSLIWRRKWPLTAPAALSPCPSVFRVSTLPSANLVLKFRRESKRPAFSCPLNKAACLGESRHPLSAVTLSPYPPLISSVLARSLVVIRAY